MCQADKYFLKSQKGILVFGEKNASILSIRPIQSIFFFSSIFDKTSQK
jgi:hypothetical protein